MNSVIAINIEMNNNHMLTLVNLYRENMQMWFAPVRLQSSFQRFRDLRLYHIEMYLEKPINKMRV